MKLGLIGKTLSHSFSMKYFEDKFKELHLSNYSYDLIESDNLESIKDVFKAYDGLNVTIPYKEKIIPYLDEVDLAAERIGAVNTIKIVDNKALGFNTDAFGFRQSIKPFLEGSHDRALILGTGGAAKAVHYVFDSLGIPCTFVSRKNESSDFKDKSLAWNDLNKYIYLHHKIIVNCTPMGMYPNTSEYPEIDFAAIGPEHFVIDLIYNPKKTVLLERSEAHGALILNGKSMLHHQAEQAWRIWNDQI